MYNNRFNFSNPYEEFRKKQDQDRQNLAKSYDPNKANAEYRAADGTNTTYPNPTSTAKKWFGNGNDLESFRQELQDKYGTGLSGEQSKWNNYGTGNLFTDSWQFSGDKGDFAKDEYDQLKDVNDQYNSNYDNILESYRQIASEVDRSNQMAAIQKNQNLLNMRNMSTAQGRGGLGNTETGYRRAENNYSNALNNTFSRGNDAVNKSYATYEETERELMKMARMIEEQARGEYGDYQLGKIKDTLYGTDDVDGLLNSYLSSGGTYGAVEGKENSEKSYDAYLTKAKEDELIALIDKTFGDNAYFMGTSAHNDAKSSMFDSVRNLGTKNQSYNDYLKYDADQKLTNPNRYADRGAVGTVGDTFKESRYNNYASYVPAFGTAGGYGVPGIANGTLMGYQVNFQDKKRHVSGISNDLNDKLNSKHSKVINGDVIKVDNKFYVKNGNKWYKIN